MSGWFDGTFEVSRKALNIIFPNKIANNVYSDVVGRRIVVFFNSIDLKNDTKYISVQPYDNKGNDLLIYFPFFNEDAPKVARFIKEQMDVINQHQLSYEEQLDETKKKLGIEEHNCELLKYHTFSETSLAVLLVEESTGTLILVGTYEYVDALSQNYDVLCDSDNTYTAIPLRRIKYTCPICGSKSLDFRGYFEICRECGWEDDGHEGLDDVTLPNGNWTIKEYRINYFKNKIKNPSYNWDKDNDGEFLLNTDIDDLFKDNK